MSKDFNNFVNEIESELEKSKVDECLNLFITKINENKEVIENEKQVREVCYAFLGMDKIFGSISKINEELLQKTTKEDKSQLWIIYYLIYYSGQLYPHLYTHLLFNNIYDKVVNDIKEIPISDNELLYQSSLRICYKIGHLHKLSNRDLDIFNEQIIETLLEFIEHTRNYHDETVNYSIIEFLMVLSYQIENNIKSKKSKNRNTTNNVNPILGVLEKRINHSKTLSENLIFILNRTDDFSVKYYLLKFLNLIFTTPSLDKFFYTNDIPVLLDITLRELWNLTDENTHIQKAYLILLENLIQNTINNNIPYRYHDITKLLYAVSQRGKDSCYSNKIQHAKLVALSNLAQRILNTFSNILDTSTLTPVHSADNLVALNKQESADATPTPSTKSKDKKKKSKMSSVTSSNLDTPTPNKKEFKKGVNPLNRNKAEPIKNNDNDKENDNTKEEKDESDQENEHERLSQRARDIFMKSYQQYQEDAASASNSATTTPVVTSKDDVTSDPESPISPPVQEEKENEEEEEDRDHEKLSKKAMDIFMKSYQQYQENSASSTPVMTAASEPSYDTTIQAPSSQEPPMSPVKENKDHDKLSQRAMDIFMKSLQQYNDEQEVVHSATLPPTYAEQEETKNSQPTQASTQNNQENIYSANSYFPHDASNPSQSYYTNVNIINNNASSPRRRDNDTASISSNSTVSNVNSFPIPTRYDSMGNRSIADPIERHQSPFSDCYQIPSQNQGHDKYKPRPPVASPALSAVSYQSNYSTSSIPTNAKPYFPAKANNIFKRENLNNNSNHVKPNNISPLNYGGRKSSYSSNTSSHSPRLNYGGNNGNRVNPLNNIFASESIVIEDPIKRHESPFDDSFSIE